jgi:hypothetical protein
MHFFMPLKARAAWIPLLVFLFAGAAQAAPVELRQFDSLAHAEDSAYDGLKRRAQGHFAVRLATGIPLAYGGVIVGSLGVGTLVVNGLFWMWGAEDLDWKFPGALIGAGALTLGSGVYILTHPTKTEKARKREALERKKTGRYVFYVHPAARRAEFILEF